MPKHTKANQFQKLPNQSQAHERVRTILCEDPVFSRLHCYQEMPVQELCPSYSSNLHRFDWFIQELNLVIEIHGEQHYRPTAWTNMAHDKKMISFAQGKARDSMKKQAAEDQGLSYLEIPYKLIEKLDGPRLMEILENRCI